MARSNFNVLDNWRPLVPAFLSVTLGIVVDFLDWYGRAESLMRLIHFPSKWAHYLSNPIVHLALIVGGILWLFHLSTKHKEERALFGADGKPVPLTRSVQEVAAGRFVRLALSAIIVGIIFALLLVWFTSIPVNPLFRSAYDANTRELGNPTAKAQSAGEMPYQAAHELAMVFWSQALVGFYKLPHDQKMRWEFEYDPTWDDQNPVWGDDKQLRELIRPPEGKNPPHYGVASHWHKNPQNWEKQIGWLNWDCLFYRDTVFFQRFEHGMLIGPLRVSKKLEVADVLVILDDHSWHPVDFQGSIKCR